MNLADIIRIKFPTVDLINQVIIQDDGEGPYISVWDSSLGPKPNTSKILKWAEEVAEALDIERFKQRNKLLLDKLDEIDRKSIRAIRSNEVDQLNELEQQAIIIRSQLI